MALCNQYELLNNGILQSQNYENVKALNTRIFPQTMIAYHLDPFEDTID